MKKILFIFTILTISYLSNAQLLEGSFILPTGPIKIMWPIDGMIFQRVNGSADINISGTFGYFNFVNQTPEYRLFTLNPNNSQESPTNQNPSWQPLNKSPNSGDLKNFFGTKTDLATGWYRLEVRLKDVSNVEIAFRSVIFGVGDVFVNAGQSNVAGFPRSSDEFLVEHYNGNAYSTIPDAVRVINDEKSRNPITNTDITLSKMERGFPFASTFKKLNLIDPEKANEVNQEMRIYPFGYGSWCWAPLGKKFADNQNCPTLFFNTGVPNSDINTWGNPVPAGGVWLPRMFRNVTQMYAHILGSAGVNWHQGERDAEIHNLGQPTYDNDTYTYYNGFLTNLIANARTHIENTNLPFNVSKNSYYTTNTDNTGFNYYPNSFPFPANSNLLQSVQNSIANSNTHGIYSDDIGPTLRGPTKQIHFSGTTHEIIGQRWYDVLTDNSTRNPVAGKQLVQLEITHITGNQYKLKPINVPAGYDKFFWVKNERGIYNIENTANNLAQDEFFTPNITEANPVYYTCYIGKGTDITADDGYDLPLIISQSFVAYNSADANRNITISNNNLSFTNTFGSNNIIEVISKTVLWTATALDAWISVTANPNGGDGTKNITIQVSANSNANPRTGTVRITGDNNTTLDITINQNGTTTVCTGTQFLSDLPYNFVYQEVSTPKRDKNVSGGTLQISGFNQSNIYVSQTFLKGIGTHANSEIRFPINGQSLFEAYVGRDDTADNCGCVGDANSRIIFTIKAKDANNAETMLTTAILLGPDDAAQKVSLDVAGKIELIFITTAIDQNFGDHANWADA